MAINKEKYLKILNMAEADLAFNRVAYSFEEFTEHVAETGIEATIENYNLYDKLCWSLVDEACEMSNLLD